MKEFIKRFKKTIKFLITIIASREMAFIYCLVGTISQTAHTYYLLDGISSLNGWWKITQSVFLAFFISSSLLYFTAISDNEDKSTSGKRVLNAVMLFMWLEIIINLYYYSKHIIIDTNNYDIKNLFQLGFGILIACIIPVTIKLYSSQIRAKEWLEDDDENKGDIISGPVFDEEAFREQINKQIEDVLSTTKFENNNDVVNQEHEKTISDLIEIVDKKLELFPEFGSNPKEYINDIINQKLKEVDGKISESFKNNSEMFLKQFQNKINLMTK